MVSARWPLKIRRATSSSSKRSRVADAVDDGGAASLGGHDVAAAQDGELLRDRRCGRSDRVLELPDAQRPPAEQLEDPDPHRVGERLEELRLELPEPLRVIAPLVADHAAQQYPARSSDATAECCKNWNVLVSFHAWTSLPVDATRSPGIC